MLSQKDKIESDVLPAEITESQVLPEDLGEKEIPMDLKSVVEIAESQAIIRAMQKAAFNKSKCAELLGIDRKTLYNKINAYGIKNMIK